MLKRLRAPVIRSALQLYGHRVVTGRYMLYYGRSPASSSRYVRRFVSLSRVGIGTLRHVELFFLSLPRLCSAVPDKFCLPSSFRLHIQSTCYCPLVKLLLPSLILLPHIRVSFPAAFFARSDFPLEPFRLPRLIGMACLALPQGRSRSADSEETLCSVVLLILSAERPSRDVEDPYHVLFSWYR